MVEQLAIGLVARWGALALAVAPFVLTATVSTAFFLVHRLVSGRDPEELPLTTGEWVSQALDAQGLDHVKVGPTDPLLSGVEGYIPSVGYLALQPATYRRRDPVQWAMGAHELGHALHLQQPALRALFLTGNAVSRGAGRLVSAGLVTAVLVGGPVATTLAFVALLVALLADAIVLLDEVWASATALRLLREDDRLSAGQLARALASVVAALGAHVSGAVARIALLALWIPITSPLDAPLLDLPVAPWPVLPFLAGLTLILGKRAVRVGLRALARRPEERLSDVDTRAAKEHTGDLAGGLGALLVVGFALTLPPSPWRDAGIVLAMVPALVPVSELLGGFVLLPLRLLREELTRASQKEALLRKGLTPEDALAAASGATPDGLSAKLAILAMNNEPSLQIRALEILRILYVPLLFIVWVQAILHLAG